MGLFDRVERKLDRAINGAFARAFRAEVQPVEIAAAMRRAMDDRAAVVGQGRTLVPNRFVVELDPNDHQRLTQYRAVLQQELIASVEEHAASQHYQPGGPLQVDFVVRDDLDTGVFRVRPTTGDAPHRDGADVRPLRGDAPAQRRADSAPHRPRNSPAPHDATMAAEGEVGLAGHAASAAAGAAAGTAAAARAGGAWPAPRLDDSSDQQARHVPLARHHDMTETRSNPAVRPATPHRPDPSQRPYLDVDGDIYPLLGALTVLGRDTTADITFADAGVSRRHAEIRVTPDGPHLVVALRDLGSTNGTFVNGERITDCRLVDGDRVTMGRLSLTVRTRGR